jgi:hypothetical protein
VEGTCIYQYKSLFLYLTESPAGLTQAPNRPGPSRKRLKQRVVPVKKDPKIR